MKKTFNTADLLDGLTGGLQSPVQEEGSIATSPEVSRPSNVPHRGRPSMNRDEMRYTSIAQVEVYNKCRAIASIENIPLKEVLNYGMKKVVEEYEKTHGPVRVKRSRKKGNIEDIF